MTPIKILHAFPLITYLIQHDKLQTDVKFNTEIPLLNNYLGVKKHDWTVLSINENF